MRRWRGQTPLPAVQAILERWRDRATILTPLTLTCYGHATCSLCDKAKVPIARLVADSGGQLRAEWIDIQTDPQLQAQWGERIPVICVGDQVVAEGKVSELRLRRALADLRQEQRQRYG